MEAVLHDWPFAGLALAVLLVAQVLRERRPEGAGSRWNDPAFVLRLLWPMYLVHQFEEHGVDLLGRRYAFLADICATIGHPDVATCPGDAAFIFAVNVVACPLAFLMPILWSRSRPLLAAFGWSIPLVNALAHIGAAVAHRGYNPGLATSLILFLPLCLWMLRVLLASGVLRPTQVPLLFLAGGLVHAVLVGSLLARANGLIGEAALLAINCVNGLVPFALGLAAGGASVARRTAPAARG